MPSIGQGVLPDPNTVDATVYDAWLVISTDPEVKDKYYELIGSPPNQDWVLIDENIVEGSDPVKREDGSVIRIRDLSTQIQLQALPTLP